MPKLSAGLLVYRRRAGELEVLLVHPGGPFWARRDDGAWSIPKGEHVEGEDALTHAKREFAEELGRPAPNGEYISLGSIRQRGGKVVSCWAVAGSLEAASIESNVFEIEWPPKSGTMRQFPEVDRAGWFTIDAARNKLLKGQVEFLDRLTAISQGDPM